MTNEKLSRLDTKSCSFFSLVFCSYVFCVSYLLVFNDTEGM